jgi:hypothetical protein
VGFVREKKARGGFPTLHVSLPTHTSRSYPDRVSIKKPLRTIRYHHKNLFTIEKNVYTTATMNPNDQPHASVLRGLQQFRVLLRAVPAQFRAPVSEFWRVLRGELRDLVEQNEALRRGATIDRPPTTDSIIELRKAFDEELAQVGMDANASATVLAIRELPPAFVLKKLEEERVNITGTSSPFFSAGLTECWVSSLASGHERGYVKKNWRNTPHPLTRQPIGANPYLHQLAVVAGGNGRLLAATAAGTHEVSAAGSKSIKWRGLTILQVSHLCHNPRCFRPSHVVVETRAENLARNSCQGHVVVTAPDGTVINPCWHWQTGVRKACILPRVVIPADMRSEHLERVQGGAFKARPRPKEE